MIDVFFFECNINTRPKNASQGRGGSKCAVVLTWNSYVCTVAFSYTCPFRWVEGSFLADKQLLSCIVVSRYPSMYRKRIYVLCVLVPKDSEKCFYSIAGIIHLQWKLTTWGGCVVSGELNACTVDDHCKLLETWNHPLPKNGIIYSTRLRFLCPILPLMYLLAQFAKYGNLKHNVGRHGERTEALRFLKGPSPLMPCYSSYGLLYLLIHNSVTIGILNTTLDIMRGGGGGVTEVLAFFVNVS